MYNFQVVLLPSFSFCRLVGVEKKIHSFIYPFICSSSYFVNSTTHGGKPFSDNRSCCLEVLPSYFSPGLSPGVASFQLAVQGVLWD